MGIINDHCNCLTNSLIPWHDPRSIVLLFSLFSVAFAILNFLTKHKTCLSIAVYSYSQISVYNPFTEHDILT